MWLSSGLICLLTYTNWRYCRTRRTGSTPSGRRAGPAGTHPRGTRWRGSSCRLRCNEGGVSLSALCGVLFFFFLFSFGGKCHIIPWVVVVKACAAFTLRRKGARIFYTGGRVDRGPWAVVVVVDDDVDRLRAGVVVWEGWGVSALCPRRACCSLGLGTLADAGGRDILTPKLPIQLR